MISHILTAILSCGATVTLINTWGKVKLKRMDIAAQERAQFIREVDMLREQMNVLYKNYYALLKENADLKIEVAELRSKVNG